MEIYIYDKAYNLLLVIDSWISLRWRRQLYGTGEFELHTQATDTKLAAMQTGNFIKLIEDEGPRTDAGVIESIEISDDEEAEAVIKVTGRLGIALLEERVITPTISWTGTIGLGMSKIITDNCINRDPPHPDIAIGNITAGNNVEFQVTWGTVSATLAKLGKAAMMGFEMRMVPTAGKWYFDTIPGVDHSVQNTAGNPFVLFSDEYANVDNPLYQESIRGYANYAYVGGEGEGSDRVIVTVDHTNGEPRRELWVDAKDIRQEEDMTLTRYRELLTARGEEKLAAAGKVKNFEVGMVNADNFRYREDWDLGDIVSVEKWGILISSQVTEVEEIYEGGVVQIVPVCGSAYAEGASASDTLSGTNQGAVSLSGLAADIKDLETLTAGMQSAIDGKAPSTHTHSIANVTGLQAALDAKAASSHAHTIANVTGLQTALDAKAAASHTHSIANVTGLQTALDAKAASSHAHAIANVTGLQTALDAKAASSHSHTIANVTGLQAAIDAKMTTPTTHGSGNNIAYRFPNGLQIAIIKVTHNSQAINTAWGSLFESGEKAAVNYVVAFNAQPSVSGAVQGSIHAFLSTGGGSATTSPKYALLRPASTAASNYVVTLIAIGTWK